MAYNFEIVSLARAKLAQQKLEREEQLRVRLLDAYRQTPRLQQIDMELQKNMAYALQEAFTQGSDPVAVMEQARQKNQVLQQERDALAAQVYPAGWLDESPICSRCGGSGYIGSTMCICLESLCRQEQQKKLEAMNLGDHHFGSFRLDYYPTQYNASLGFSPRSIMEKTLNHCREFAAAFTQGAGNLLFVGGTGLGKTFLATAVAKAVSAQGCSVSYEGAISLFSKLERARFSPGEDSRREVEDLTNADLLIIDDLGTELPGAFVTSSLYGLLEERLRLGKSMIVTTNLTYDELAKRYTPRVASRLYGDFALLSFVGSDIRMLRSQNP
ncbi:MAG: ATP-binding protein [Oscillospiraceae bacterium]|nr:ATP-binding protein [Oscillospiraceae bacterium]